MLAAPYAQLVPLAATAPALILVGGLMMAPLVDIAWDDPEAAIPAFLTVALIPLTFSIANGLAFGITAYALLKLIRGRITRTDWLLLALAALFVAPYAQLVPLAATAPALILVGGLMMAPLVDVAWDDPEIAIPAFLTVAMIPLTFSIANGLAFGITAYALIKLIRGKITRTDWLLLVISALFVARFVWLSAG